MKHPLTTMGLVAITALFLTGCSIQYPYTLILSVKNASDNCPVPGVSVKLDTFGNEEQKLNMDYPFSNILDTDADGQGSYNFDVHLGQGYHWYLKLQKEGYEMEVIDIKPATESTNTKERTPLKIEVRMRPLAK